MSGSIGIKTTIDSPGKLISISPEGKIEISPISGPPGLEAFSKIVGGYIEQVGYFDTVVINSKVVPCVVFCNEEGKLDGLPFNAIATTLWKDALAHHNISMNDVLVGSIAIVTGKDIIVEL